MRPRLAAMVGAICFWGAQAMAADGMITRRSTLGPAATMQRLEVAVRAKGLTVFAHIDHAAGAAAVGLALRPTDLLVFGNAQGGTPLMQAGQTIGIDLPLKMLVWQDEAGATFVSYNDPAWLAQRHGVVADASVRGMAAALAALAETATTER